MFGIIWLLIFMFRKDLRREMFWISGAFGIGGLTSQITNIQDYWRPITITGTSIGPEDYLIGFFIGGISSTIYSVISKKAVYLKEFKLIRIKSSDVFIIFPILYFGGFYFLHLGSAYSTLLAFITTTLYLLLKRKDLLSNSIKSGVYMMILGVITYLFMLFIDREFITNFWFLDDVWYSKMIFSIPLGEYIWFFLAGCFIGPLYEYWQKGKVVELNK